MTPSREMIGVLVVNFGEPENLAPEVVQSYLERIFLQNVDLENHEAEAAVARAKQLAARRAPGLIEEYEAIGGSPLNRQVDAQVGHLLEALVGRGWAVKAYSALQFMEPTIADKVREAHDDGVEHLVVVPLYPICGASTTVAAIARVQQELEELDWSPRLNYVAGWHDHPDYVSLRVSNIREYVEANGLDLSDPDTLLYFSVHGTPLKYLNEGNRYDRYVEEHTRRISTELRLEGRYTVGFQNHSNRKIEWTQPNNEDRIDTLAEHRMVVVPISFMHEQSETLGELDHDLRDYVEEKGKEFYRVPVPHDDARFIGFLTELVSALVGRGAEDAALTPCRCSLVPGVLCTNGERDLPPSPYVPESPAR